MHAVLLSADYIKNTFFKKNLSGIPSGLNNLDHVGGGGGGGLVAWLLFCGVFLSVPGTKPAQNFREK